MTVSTFVLAAALSGCALAAPASPVRADASTPTVNAPRAAPPAAASPVPAASRQLLLVTTDGWAATAGRLQRYERTGAAWRAVGAPVETVVGRAGMGWGRGLHSGDAARPGDPAKREGDGRAPAGAFRLSAAFGYAPTEPTGLPYLPTDADTECVDDTASAAYNTVIRRTPADDWRSHEEMRLDAPVYRIGVVVAHNGPGVDVRLVPGAPRAATVRGAGSCIFLHVWRTPATATSGCTAMPDADLQAVLAWLDASAEPVLVQLPRTEADRLRSAWALP